MKRYIIPAGTTIEIWEITGAIKAKMLADRSELQVIYTEEERFSDSIVKDVLHLNADWYWFTMPRMCKGGNVVAVYKGKLRVEDV